MAAASEDSTKESEGDIPPWADGDRLRKVEKNVLIPKKMREKARESCKDLVEGKMEEQKHCDCCKLHFWFRSKGSETLFIVCTNCTKSLVLV